jgi:hypothetical protein
MLHLCLPEGRQRLTRANLLVPTTRPSLWSQLHLLAPLWPPDDAEARRAYIASVQAALRPHPDYVHEMQRLRHLAAATARRHAAPTLRDARAQAARPSAPPPDEPDTSDAADASQDSTGDDQVGLTPAHMHLHARSTAAHALASQDAQHAATLLVCAKATSAHMRAQARTVQ